MAWDSTNRAHACLWIFETWDRNQRTASFTEAGEWSTAFLIRDSGGSGDTAESKARNHANKLDGTFRNVFGASYETDVTNNAAINAMVSVLRDSTKTLGDLGDPVDQHYHFLGEAK